MNKSTKPSYVLYFDLMLRLLEFSPWGTRRVRVIFVRLVQLVRLVQPRPAPFASPSCHDTQKVASVRCVGVMTEHVTINAAARKG